MSETKKSQNNRPKGVEFKKTADGKDNPKYIDILEEDRPISEQKFVCMSFVSPEKIIKQKEMFFLNKFIKQWDMNKSLEKYNHFLNFVSFKYSLPFEDLTKDLEEFCTSEKDNLFITNLEDDYKTYLDKNEEQLNTEFQKDHEFQTNVRGIKVRGSYPTQEEAEMRCKMLREIDPNHDVFVGPVGTWMPFDPEAYKTGKVEYLEEELNQLMQEKVKNEAKAKSEFEKRISDAKKKAIADNVKKAAESGNKLTQTLNKDGNLVSVKDVNTLDNRLSENVAVADIRKELFEGDNIVTQTENTDKGLSRLSEEARDNLERAFNTTGVNQIESAETEASADTETTTESTTETTTESEAGTGETADTQEAEDSITMEVVEKKE